MARVQNVLIGKASGSIGNATFSSWKGINVLKSKAIQVANPRTDGQVRQRNRLTVMVAFFRLVSAAVALGFREGAIKMSEYNAFIRENVVNGTQIVNGNDARLVAENILISKGSMGVTQVLTATVGDVAEDFEVTWDGDNIPVGGSASDIALLVARNRTTNEVVVARFTDTRVGGFAFAAFSEPINNAGDVDYWLGFYSQVNDTASDSVFGQGV